MKNEKRKTKNEKTKNETKNEKRKKQNEKNETKNEKRKMENEKMKNENFFDFDWWRRNRIDRETDNIGPGNKKCGVVINSSPAIWVRLL